MSAILRHHPNRFTVLPNDAIRNPALSFRAVGVLAHLLSLPAGARVDSAGAHEEGRDAVRSAFGELDGPGQTEDGFSGVGSPGPGQTRRRSVERQEKSLGPPRRYSGGCRNRAVCVRRHVRFLAGEGRVA